MTSGPFDDDLNAPGPRPAEGVPSDPFDPTGIERLREDAQDRGEKADAVRSFWKELPFLIIVALVVAVVIKTFLVQAFFIPSASMHDTLVEGDRVMVNKLAYRFGEPHRGDIIVFDSPLVTHDQSESFLGKVVRNVGEALGLSTPESALIKRVIALGGETIEIRGNRIYIDGVALDEPYLTRPVDMDPFGPLTIPEGFVFVMGDNRNQSEDGRVFGPIPESDIIGRAFVRVWPPSRWGGL
ncbi:MAG TPA: signal peptidase I [Acidimicrobiia bacterium]